MNLSVEILESEMERQGLSPKSVLAYGRVWREFFAFCSGRGITPESLGEEQAREFFLQTVEGKGAASQIQTLAALRRVYALARTDNPFDLVERPKASALNVETRSLAPDELGRLFQLLGNNKDYYGRMTYVLTLSLFDLARRFFEVAEATRAQLVLDAGQPVALKILGKGNKHSVKPLTARLASLLGEWIGFVDLSKGARIRSRTGMEFSRSDLLFPTLEGKTFSNQAYNRRLASACRQAKVPQISAHVLRHSAATYLMNSGGVTLPELKDILDHSDIRTTVRYIHNSPARLAAAMEKLGHVTGQK